jgi:flagellar motor protein MotB
MSTGRGISIIVVAFLSVTWIMGCGPSAAEMQIQKLQEDVDALTARNNELASQLADAQRNADMAGRRALELQKLLDEAKRALAERREAPAPDLPEGWTGTKDIAWTDIADDILFDSGRADLKSQGRTKLSEVARTIQATFGDRAIWVIGHTDNEPIVHSATLWKDNLDLSANRAMTVVREFYKLGIDARRLVAGGQGEHNPKAPNASKGTKALNRRVQVVAVRVPQPTAVALEEVPAEPRAAKRER